MIRKLQQQESGCLDRSCPGPVTAFGDLGFQDLIQIFIVFCRIQAAGQLRLFFRSIRRRDHIGHLDLIGVAILTQDRFAHLVAADPIGRHRRNRFIITLVADVIQHIDFIDRQVDLIVIVYCAGFFFLFFDDGFFFHCLFFHQPGSKAHDRQRQTDQQQKHHQSIILLFLHALHDNIKSVFFFIESLIPNTSYNCRHSCNNHP